MLLSVGFSDSLDDAVMMGYKNDLVCRDTWIYSLACNFYIFGVEECQPILIYLCILMQSSSAAYYVIKASAERSSCCVEMRKFSAEALVKSNKPNGQCNLL